MDSIGFLSATCPNRTYLLLLAFTVNRRKSYGFIPSTVTCEVENESLIIQNQSIVRKASLIQLNRK
jgi:hypothetical protein